LNQRKSLCGQGSPASAISKQDLYQVESPSSWTVCRCWLGTREADSDVLKRYNEGALADLLFDSVISEVRELLIIIRSNRKEFCGLFCNLFPGEPWWSNIGIAGISSFLMTVDLFNQRKSVGETAQLETLISTFSERSRGLVISCINRWRTKGVSHTTHFSEEGIAVRSRKPVKVRVRVLS
jgi:hypothetical protein